MKSYSMNGMRAFSTLTARLLCAFAGGTACLSVTAKAPDIDTPILLGRVLAVSPGGVRKMESGRLGRFNWRILRKHSDSQCLITRDTSVSSDTKQHSDQLSRVQAAPPGDSKGIIVYRVEDLRVRARFGILPLIVYNTSTDLTRIDLKGSIRLAGK